MTDSASARQPALGRSLSLESATLLGTLAGSIAIVIVLVSTAILLSFRLSQLMEQQLGWDIATEVARRLPPLRAITGSEAVITQLAAIHRESALYILDANGRVIYPTTGVVRSQVAVSDIRAALRDEVPDLPLLGDDPQQTSGSVAFSVAPLVTPGDEGYVYVTLPGSFDERAARDSGVLFRLGLHFLPGLLGALLTSGLLAYIVTANYRRLVALIEKYSGGDYREEFLSNGVDEISQLGREVSSVARLMLGRTRELDSRRVLRHNLLVRIGHDLRGPLTGARASVETLLAERDEPTSNRVVRLFDAIRHSLASNSRLLTSLDEIGGLEVAREQLNLEPVAVASLASEVVTRYVPQGHAAGIRVVHQHTGTTDPVIADRAMIERVLGNLVSNALRYTPEGGVITLRTAGRDGGVDVEVSDTGAGIPAEALPSLFQPFFRADNQSAARGSGTGLGLSIVQRLLELHDSCATVESVPGKGTSFRFTLARAPLGRAAADDSAPSPKLEVKDANAPRQVPASSFRILLLSVCAGAGVAMFPVGTDLHVWITTLFLFLGIGFVGLLSLRVRWVDRAAAAVPLGVGMYWWLFSTRRPEVPAIAVIVGGLLGVLLSFGFHPSRRSVVTARLTAAYSVAILLSVVLQTFALSKFWDHTMFRNRDALSTSVAIARAVEKLPGADRVFDSETSTADFKAALSELWQLDPPKEVRVLNLKGEELMRGVDPWLQHEYITLKGLPASISAPFVETVTNRDVRTRFLRGIVPVLLGGRPFLVDVDFGSLIHSQGLAKAFEPFFLEFAFIATLFTFCVGGILFRMLSFRLVANVAAIRRTLDAFARGSRLELGNDEGESKVIAPLMQLGESVLERTAQIEQEDERLRVLARSAAAELAAYRTSMEPAIARAECGQKNALHEMEHRILAEAQLVDSLFALALHETGSVTPAPVDIDVPELLDELSLDLVGFAHLHGCQLKCERGEPLEVHADATLFAGMTHAIMHSMIRRAPEQSELNVATLSRSPFRGVRLARTIVPDDGIASSATASVERVEPAAEESFRDEDPDLGLTIAGSLAEVLGMQVRLAAISATGETYEIDFGKM